MEEKPLTEQEVREIIRDEVRAMRKEWYDTHQFGDFMEHLEKKKAGIIDKAKQMSSASQSTR